jgi:histidinol-phosphate aminotransferase
MSWIEKLARPDLLGFKAYEHAAWEPGLTRLHANEVPWRATRDESAYGLNRYPEPQPHELLDRLAQIYQMPSVNLLLSRGSDEAIDLLVRAFCRAGEDSVLICPPTFGMYATAARIQGAGIVSVPLNIHDGFSLDADAVIGACGPSVKLVFLCSPNNPTGNLLAEEAMLKVINALAGRALVVVDEAYIEFADRPSLAALITRCPHVAVLRTLSKAHGLAGARLGVLIADPEVVAFLRRLIAPYAIPQTTVEALLPILGGLHSRALSTRIKEIRAERTRFFQALRELPGVTQVYPSDANFLLARFRDPDRALAGARRVKLLLRDARGYPGLSDALRITVGTAAQDDLLLGALR